MFTLSSKCKKETYMNKNKEYEKILFKYYSNILDKVVAETMWAKIIDESKGIFQLDSIPFYGPPIAPDDEFIAKFDEDQQILKYIKTLNYSGNSVIIVSISKNDFDKEILREKLKKMNCTSETLNKSYFSMEVLKKVNYKLIKRILENYEKNGTIEYAEPCLSEKHRKDLKIK